MLKLFVIIVVSLETLVLGVKTKGKSSLTNKKGSMKM